MTKAMVRKKDTAVKKVVAAKRKGAAAKKSLKQPSARAQRIAKKKAPKAVENTKQVIFLRGSKTSELVGDVMKDLFGLRKPFGVMMQRKNENMHPFDDATSLEFLAAKNDCSIFCVANHSKKRPHNLVVGRTFDGHVLDMVELGVESATTLDDLQLAFPEASIQSKRLGSKPCVCFVGEAWEQNIEHKQLRSLLLDFVKGQEVKSVNLASLDHVLCFTAVLDRIFLRTYALNLRKPTADSGSNVPQTRLVLSAPSVEFKLRRTRWASKELMKGALRQAKELKPKKTKNVKTTALGETLGQLHMQRQDYGKLQTRKVKALHAHKAVALSAPEGSQTVGLLPRAAPKTAKGAPKD